MMKKNMVGALAALVGISVGAGVTGKKMWKIVSDTQRMSEKHLALYLMMNQWVKVKHEGKSLELYFRRNGYEKIAIYGMSYAGETLVEELKGSQVEVRYGIDKKAANLYADIDIFRPDERLEDVDAIVVTSIFFFKEVEKQLSQQVTCPILSLEDILYEV